MHDDETATLSVAKRLVGIGHPCLIIAEIAQAHDGSLGTAHAYITAAARAGADAVKFQTHIAAAESTPQEPWRVHFSRQDATRYDYWRRMEFTPEAWEGLRQHAHEAGLIFLSSPFSLQAVDLLQDVGVPAWKIGSGEITNLPLLDRVAQTNLPVFLSSGMATQAEMDAAVRRVREVGAPVAVFQCTSRYPCPPEQLGLPLLQQLRQRYACPIGLSDHSGSCYAGIAAAALGANMLEVHIVFSEACFGPDVTSSQTLEEFGRMVEGIRFVEQALADAKSKDDHAAQLGDVRYIFAKSIVAPRYLPAGHTLRSQDVVLKKPGGGLGGADIANIVGKRLTRSLQKDEQITWQHVEA